MNGQPAEVSHDEWAALAVGHAMNALEPEDEQSFLSHLPNCGVCAGVVVDTEVVMGHLAYAVEPLEPPKDLVSAIRAVTGPTERRPAAPVPIAVARSRRTARLTSRPWLAVAAGLALLMALSVWNVVLHTGNRSKDRRIAQDKLITDCLRETGCRTVELRTPNSDQPRATALVRSTEVQLLATELPRNDVESEIYVLWQRSVDKRLVPLRSFDITRPGVTVIQSRLATALSKVDGLAVSREPHRRTPPAPTGIVAIGTLSG